MKATARIFLSLLLGWLPLSVCCAQQHEDTEKLGMALEYFKSGKYHEALLLFRKLDENYQLNARFRAYIGLCYYHEWDYKKAAQYLDETIPQLSAVSPREQNVYCYAAAESYFALHRYQEAATYYNKCLTVCYERDKGDIYYRLGFCHVQEENWEAAATAFRAAQTSYRQHRDTAALQARMAQIERMAEGCEQKMAAEAADSLPHAGVDETQRQEILHGTDDVDAGSAVE